MAVRTMTPWAGADQAQQRIVDAALSCIARVGVTKTTIDDVAAEAGCSRATLYRYVRGKRQLVECTVAHETSRVLTALDTALDGIDDLEDALVTGILLAASEFERHAALQFVLRHEPEVVLPHLSFGAGDKVLATVAALAGPRLERYLPTPAAHRLAEWIARIVMSYVCNPSPNLRITDPDDVRRLVHDFVLPGAGLA